MKWLALLLVAVIGVAAYSAHVQSLKEAEEKAEMLAYNQTKAQIEQERESRAAQERKAAAAREQRPQMAIAKALDPLWLQLQAPLNLEEPADLLPVVHVTTQHIMERRVDVQPARGVVFDRAAALLNYLAAVAEERTKALKSMIRNRTGATALSQADASSFFNQGVAKHWDETLARARPAVNQLMQQLRAAEQEWNKQARPGGYPEEYDLAGLTPVMIPLDLGGSSTLSNSGSAPPASHGAQGMGAGSRRRLPGQ